MQFYLEIMGHPRFNLSYTKEEYISTETFMHARV